MDPLIPQETPAAPVTPADPPPKKKNWLMIAGIAVLAFIIFVLLIVSCVFSMGGPAMKAGELFLTQVTAGQVDQAYDSAAAQFKQAVPKDAFSGFLKQYPIATKMKSVSFSSFNITGDSATVSGTITGTDLTTAPVHMRLVNETGAWRVLYVDFLTPEQEAQMAYTQQMMQQAAQQQAAQQAQGGQMQPPQGGTQQLPPGAPGKAPVTGEAPQGAQTAPAVQPVPGQTPSGQPSSTGPATPPTK